MIVNIDAEASPPICKLYGRAMYPKLGLSAERRNEIGCLVIDGSEDDDIGGLFDPTPDPMPSREARQKVLQARRNGEIVKYEELMTQYGATRISFTHSPLRIG